ncbi:TetR family transcriptional regulator [Desulfosporosinus sp. SB140]|uniref:TetR family transcriptional regulator n=1 Tax=Desulfosporosinus paludis TaxID=3115649 RepID=UPI00388F2301
MRQERRDAAENRQRILDAAIKLFEQHGVKQVSMNQIALEAHIGSGPFTAVIKIKVSYVRI